MKEMSTYIVESGGNIKLANGQIVKFDKTKKRRADEKQYYKIMAERYLEAIGGTEKLRSIINDTITKINNILPKLSNLDIEGCDGVNFCEYLNGQIIGRIFENIFASIIENVNLNGFSYKHGSESKLDKDIECKSIPSGFKLFDDKEDVEIIEYLKLHWIGNGKSGDNFFKDAKYFGIELKTYNSYKVTGNKVYATAKHDDDTKSKSSFYIILNYKKPVAPNYNITNVKAYFGFLDQMDWFFYDEGSANARINTDLLKTRFIQIY